MTYATLKEGVFHLFEGPDKICNGNLIPVYQRQTETQKHLNEDEDGFLWYKCSKCNHIIGYYELKDKCPVDLSMTEEYEVDLQIASESEIVAEDQALVKEIILSIHKAIPERHIFYPLPGYRIEVKEEYRKIQITSPLPWIKYLGSIPEYQFRKTAKLIKDHD